MINRGHQMTTAYINRIATGVPSHDVHAKFVRYALFLLKHDERSTMLLRRMAERSGIEHRYSCLSAAPAGHERHLGPTLDGESFYVQGRFPDTAARMRLFEARAPELAAKTVEKLGLGPNRNRISHLLITCTGFSAPGLDIEVIERCNLPVSVERTIVGFMGCYAAINALKLARHIVRSEPDARVLILNLELCTLHFQETTDLAQLLCFLLFSDGCAASLVTSQSQGIALDSFKAMLLPQCIVDCCRHFPLKAPCQIRSCEYSRTLIAEYPRWMEGTARKGWLIYDLQRHPLPYHFIGVAGAVLRLHPMVVHDGRISVARSLTRSEWRTRLVVAGIPRDAVELRWFLYRFVIGRMR
jgi:hypothetical protein